MTEKQSVPLPPKSQKKFWHQLSAHLFTVPLAFIAGAALALLLMGNYFSDLALSHAKSYSAPVQRAAPAVVSIRTSKRPQFRSFNNLFKPPRSTFSQGSAVILDSEGYLVTSNHLIKDFGQVMVELRDGRKASAHLIGSDRLTDLAVLKIDMQGEELPSIPLGNSQQLDIGETVLAIGNPFGVGQTVTRGIVSALGRETNNPYLQMIQTDAAINPGNSGGALINVRGELVGISSLLVSSSGTWAGIGYAIPVELVIQVVSELILHGAVQRGWLGYMEVRDVPAPAGSSPDASSLLLISIDSQGPLALAGLRASDMLLNIDGEAASSTLLRKRLAQARPGDVFELEIQRESKRYTMQVMTTSRPST